METIEIALHATVLVAAMLQAITGIGFAMIAGPFILLAMNSGSAVQVTTLLSLLIALVLAPTLISQVDKPLLKRFLVGTLIGLPIGILVFINVSVDVLKLLAGITVLFMTLSAIGVPGFGRGSEGATPARQMFIGTLSGAMCACLAMPGPVAAVHMTTTGYRKETIRATVLALFVGSYTAAFLIQSAAVGTTPEMLFKTASFVPATLVGIVIGRIVSGRISESHFRWLIIAFLVATSASLLFNSIRALV